MPKNPNQIIGSFIFRNEGDGCLTSKYHHLDSTQGPFAEAAKLIDGANGHDRFIGRYRVVWLEDNNNENCDLLIELNPNNRNTYVLNWHEPGDHANSIFEGTAMLFENLLVGAYWD